MGWQRHAVVLGRLLIENTFATQVMALLRNNVSGLLDHFYDSVVSFVCAFVFSC